MIREQLAIKETANLWCFLGDVTRNMEHYEKAWELSKHKSARAQRCMGYLYFGKEQVSDYSKTCLKRPLKKIPKLVFKTDYRLMQVKKYCRMLQGEHSAILSTFIKVPFVINILVLSIFEWPLKTGFTVQE